MAKIYRGFACLLIPIFFGCKSNNAAPGIKSPDSTAKSPVQNNDANYIYDIDKPNHVRRLPDALVEVSGNTWLDATHLILIEDLHPNLYFIQLTDTAAILQKTVPFYETDKEKTDIEDVAYTGDAVYALWSHGALFKITDWTGNPAVQKIETGLSKDNNTEGLCFDPVTKHLLIACKDNAGEADGKESDKAIYEFDPTSAKLLPQPFMTIRKKDFRGVTGDKLKYNPSAIAVHPVTHDVYLLTTKDNKGLAVFSHEGVLKYYHAIDKSLMPQPEGICFSDSGTMYISSEGKKGEPGNLFEFAAHH